MERIAIISVGLVVWMNGIGFYLAAMLTDFWMVAESDRSGGSVGLFKSCGPNPNDAFCNNQSWDPNEITLTIFLPRIIMLLAGGLLGIGMAYSSLLLAVRLLGFTSRTSPKAVHSLFTLTIFLFTWRGYQESCLSFLA
ncbi:uncharacterized protein LOC143462550 isoform X2 [Clavelina lepadiformis]|uniref:uncharacterized protein LOC143462550 isoform X2 n=1 Tax=Clavelina lepadiformis TaxID=159417 RepID=UPI00404351D8